MRLKSKFKYLYVCILIFYAVLFVFFRPKPKLNFSIKGSINQPSSYKLKNNLPIINPPTNKVSLGKTFLIKDNENWYQIIQLSFWRKKYLSLDFLNNQLNIFDIDVKITNNNNNYALGTLQGEKIVYSCMKNSNEFNYSLPEKIVDSFDINYWKQVYIDNLKLVFYSFRPKNYECFLVLTTNTKFFENSDIEINKKIFNKFIYE